jgi:hypothetical protein
MVWNDGGTTIDPYSIRISNSTNGNIKDEIFTCGTTESGSNRVFKSQSLGYSMWWNVDCWEVGLPPETGSYIALFYIPASADATTAEIAATTVGAINESATLSTVEMEAPAGWQETTELVEGLEAKGYTPEVGKVYSADTTINGNMYPSEIPAGDASDKPTAGSANVLLIYYSPTDPDTGIYAYIPVDKNATGTDRSWLASAGDEYIKWVDDGWRTVNRLDATMPSTYIGNEADPWDCVPDGHNIKTLPLE